MKKLHCLTALAALLNLTVAIPSLQAAELEASDGTNSDYLGISMRQSGSTGLVGAYQDDIGANTDQGTYNSKPMIALLRGHMPII